VEIKLLILLIEKIDINNKEKVGEVINYHKMRLSHLGHEGQHYEYRIEYQG
jgi:hypothetical protein